MQNFSLLAGLEVPEKCVGVGGVGVGGGFLVVTMSNSTKLFLSCFELSLVELSGVTLGFDNMLLFKQIEWFLIFNQDLVFSVKL